MHQDLVQFILGHPLDLETCADIESYSTNKLKQGCVRYYLIYLQNYAFDVLACIHRHESSSST